MSHVLLGTTKSPEWESHRCDTLSDVILLENLKNVNYYNNCSYEITPTLSSYKITATSITATLVARERLLLLLVLLLYRSSSNLLFVVRE